MKAVIHGFPQSFVTVDGHFEVGTIFEWVDESKYHVYKCDPIGDKPETQLQNVYVKVVTE